MKPLPREFARDQFNFRQLMREGDVVLYEKTKPHWAQPTYEVCIVRKCAERTIAGTLIPAHEALPPSESWGTYGWTYSTYDKAWARFCRLAETRAPQEPPLFSTAAR